MILADLPQEERPRERLVSYGPDALSLSELLALILGNGTKGKSVLELAADILSHFGSLRALSTATLSELLAVKGLGPAKAIKLQAALNLSKRLYHASPTPLTLDRPDTIYHLLHPHFIAETREKMVALLLNQKSQLITTEVISIGTLSKALVHPREVFYPAIRNKAASLLIAHNHPSGDPTPSAADHKITRELIATGHLLGIPLVDHLIFGNNCFLSLRQAGFPFDC